MATYSLFPVENALSLPPMRRWQERCAQEIRQAVREGHRRIVVQSPTGSGKTLLSAHLFGGSIAKGKRPVFTVPDITLVNQTLRSFEHVGIRDIGVIQADHERTNREAQVQIASVATLIRRELPDADLIVIDEVHVQYQALLKILDGPVWADKIVIGLSATPWARGMGLHWTKLIIGATIKELIAEKILCGFRIYAPNEEVDLSHVHIVKGEYDEGESSVVMRDARIVADVVKTWQERWNKDRTFMFCVDRAHAREQQAKFEAAGIPFGYIDGTMKQEERDPVFEAFRECRIKGIASVGCLCLDERTEILTGSGWVGIDQMTMQHHIAAWWNGFVDFVHPIEIFKRERLPNERMVAAKGKNIDVRVTEGHKMLWSAIRGGNFSFCSASDVINQRGFIPSSGDALPSRFIFRGAHPERERSWKHGQVYAYMKRGRSKGEARQLTGDYRERMMSSCLLKEPGLLTMDECFFIGFWLGDGSRASGVVSFSQSVVNYGVVAWFDDLVERLGVDVTRRIVPPKGSRKTDTVIWRIPWGSGGEYQKRKGVSHLDDYLNKDGSDLYWGFSKAQLLALLQGFRMADGNHGKDGKGTGRGTRIFGANKAIFDLLQSICSVREIVTNLSSKMCRSTLMHCMSFREANIREIYSDRFRFENEYKPERVWCVQSPTGAIIIRRSGKISVVGNSRGVDEDVHCIIDAKPKNSEMAFVQEIGRGLRNPNGDGKQLLILDHAGNTLRLGMVTDIHHERLDSRAPGDRSKAFVGDKKAKKPHKCPHCNAIIPYGRAKCPVCGAVLKTTSHTQHRQGELVEFSYDGKKREKPPEDKQSWYSGFLWIAKERGHSEGWAAWRFKEKFKDWPNGLRRDVAAPSREMLSYDKYLRIRYAKANQGAPANA